VTQVDCNQFPIFERVSDDLQEKVEQFEEREDALRERFQEAMG